MKRTCACLATPNCARFVLDHEGAIARAKPELPLGLNDRAADICEPLFVIADLTGGDWPELVQQAAVGLTASAEQSDPTVLLLGDLKMRFVGPSVREHWSRCWRNGGRRTEDKGLTTEDRWRMAKSAMKMRAAKNPELQRPDLATGTGIF